MLGRMAAAGTPPESTAETELLIPRRVQEEFPISRKMKEISTKHVLETYPMYWLLQELVFMIKLRRQKIPKHMMQILLVVRLVLTAKP
jgi:hypothetical protein